MCGGENPFVFDKGASAVRCIFLPCEPSEEEGFHSNFKLSRQAMYVMLDSIYCLMHGSVTFELEFALGIKPSDITS